MHCVGNTGEGEARVAWLQSRGVASARLGGVAMDIEGKRLPANYRPVLIDGADLAKYDAVMMQKTFGDHWRQR